MYLSWKTFLSLLNVHFGLICDIEKALVLFYHALLHIFQQLIASPFAFVHI